MSTDGKALRWRNLQYVVKVEMMDVPGLPGHTLGAGVSAGLASFEDGTFATIAIRFTIDFTNGTGRHVFYSQYTFEDRASFVTRGEGTTTASADGSTASFDGQITFLNGTGRFAGVSGSGKYTGRRLAKLGESAQTYLDFEAFPQTPPVSPG